MESKSSSPNKFDALPETTRERILTGALQLIASQGYKGATTRAIAEAAGVNEVTIFRQFGNKKQLFLAVLERYSAVMDIEEALQTQLSGNYRQDLIRIGTIFLRMMLARSQVILMSICEAQHDDEVREIVAQPPVRQQQLLAEYLREQMDKGVVRDLPDPDLAAQVFLAMFFEFSIRRSLESNDQPVQVEETVQQLVDIFISGTATINPIELQS